VKFQPALHAPEGLRPFRAAIAASGVRQFSCMARPTRGSPPLMRWAIHDWTAASDQVAARGPALTERGKCLVASLVDGRATQPCQSLHFRKTQESSDSRWTGSSDPVSDSPPSSASASFRRNAALVARSTVSSTSRRLSPTAPGEVMRAFEFA
jgi:hypothetical protein